MDACTICHYVSLSLETSNPSVSVPQILSSIVFLVPSVLRYCLHGYWTRAGLSGH